MGQRILDQWLTYLEPIHVRIKKAGDFGVNLELHENLIIVCYCFRGTVGSALVLTCFINVRYYGLSEYKYQLIWFVRVQSIS